MAHRYAAGTLGLLILAIGVSAWRRRRPGHWPVLPTVLVGLVMFQGLLGMWTVTLLLKPAVVTLHLLGGMATLALLCWLLLRNLPAPPALRLPESAPRGLAALALVVLVGQISLGGWTSTNYAAFFCADFPTCQGQWWPPADFAEGFVLWRDGARNYEGGLLHNEAGVAVHLSHRIGAVIAVLTLGALALRLLSGHASTTIRILGLALLIAVLAQFALGIANVLMRLPLPLAVSHNGMAALLLVLTVAANYFLRSPAAAAQETT